MFYFCVCKEHEHAGDPGTNRRHESVPQNRVVSYEGSHFQASVLSGPLLPSLPNLLYGAAMQRKSVAAIASSVDDAVGSVVDSLKQASMYENSLIVLSTE